MIRILFVLLLTGTSCSSLFSAPPPLSLSYYGQFGIQPGIKVGAIFEIPNGQKSEEGTVDISPWYIKPALTYFTYPNVNHNFMISSQFGYRHIISEKSGYVAANLSIGYLLTQHRLGGNVQIGSAEKSLEYESRHYFAPILNAEFGRLPEDGIGYFGSIGFGRRISSSFPSSNFVNLELGILFNLFSKQNTANHE